MDKKVIIEKKCKGCRYFSRHYTKQGTRINTVYCGHCLNAKNKSIKKKLPDDICELWEDVAIKKEEGKQDIKKAIALIASRLDELTLILKDDIEN